MDHQGNLGPHDRGIQQGRARFGGVTATKKIKNVDCAIVVPERSTKDIIEIVCQYHLRRTLSINDGDRWTSA